MPDQKIILTPFEKAVASLEEALAQPKTDYLRDATIQRFEYTFELAIKMLKRSLEKWPEGTTIDQQTYRDMIRMAAESGLITDPEAWFEYREARNITSHAYDEKLAEKVYTTVKKFGPDAKKLLNALKAHL